MKIAGPATTDTTTTTVPKTRKAPSQGCFRRRSLCGFALSPGFPTLVRRLPPPPSIQDAPAGGAGYRGDRGYFRSPPAPQSCFSAGRQTAANAAHAANVAGRTDTFGTADKHVQRSHRCARTGSFRVRPLRMAVPRAPLPLHQSAARSCPAASDVATFGDSGQASCLLSPAVRY